jgi:collagen type III alpha
LDVQLEQALAKELAVVVNERIEERIGQCMLEIKFLLANLPKPERGERGERGEKGEIGAQGERGEKGETGETGLAGRNGDRGERGEKGERGEVGPRGETGLIGRDGQPGVPGRDGKDGRNGIDGKDGAAGKDGENLCLDEVTFDFIDDGSTLVARFARGNVIKEAKTRIRGKHCGPWKQEAEYFRDDSVTSGGSSWFAVVDVPKCRPGDGKDWILYARKGRDGKDGDRGPAGAQGPAGKAASY